METSDLRKRVATKLAASPLVLGPGLIGATLLAAGVAIGAPLLGFAGAIGIAIGIGTLVTRFVFGFDRAVAREVERQARRERQRMQLELNRLERRLMRDDDSRTEGFLRRLRAMQRSFEKDLRKRHGSAGVPAQLAEIVAGADRLFSTCIAGLERSIDLFETADGMHTDSMRRRTFEAREHVLNEVERSIDHLGRVMDGVTALAVLRPNDAAAEARMAAVRAELDESFAVATRVEERMQEIRHSLDRSEPVADGGMTQQYERPE